MKSKVSKIQAAKRGLRQASPRVRRIPPRCLLATKTCLGGVAHRLRSLNFFQIVAPRHVRSTTTRGLTVARDAAKPRQGTPKGDPNRTETEGQRHPRTTALRHRQKSAWYRRKGRVEERRGEGIGKKSGGRS